ncbi:MAG: tannase/feruloyl esterase family alpha/beta hydrolase [Sphingomonadales bacterium]|nr:tannase/feruloyl esterase family alpha/beta hydrolase [Sphingomonadales bacterium]
MAPVVAGLSTKVTVQPVKNGTFRGATRFLPATTTRPAFCQVSGSFETNPATGKTANFLANFPAAWNGKYLQLGCSGHCGQFYVSDPATPAIVVTAQGHPGQLIEKGYATFATDEGHVGMESASWAVKDGKVDQDYIDDFLYRADKVMARMGKEFTTAFYAKLNGTVQQISRSYFNGCSGGGRDAMVAASYFPEEFDGIIAGSPYDTVGMTMQASATGLATHRSPDAMLTPALLALMDKVVKDQCDGLDGVKDGLIQNPAACNFRPERDLPRCTPGKTGDQCFTKGQIETVATIVHAVTDDQGRVVQPGYSASELQELGGGLALLSDPNLKIFVHRNDPAYALGSSFSFRYGGPGPVTGFHAVVSSAEAAAVGAALHAGAGHIPENAAKLMAGKTKLMIWHNFSDEKLTPFSSINWYKRLARNHGGYARVQQQARLFMLPGTSHCSIAGIAPNSFDAMTAMENWVEHGKAPESLLATVADHQFTPGAVKAPALKSPNWTMPLCKFPEMARYAGHGDTQDARNWSCQANDRRLLQVGVSGREAGVLN